jgi:hypothetical protein
MAQKFTSLFSLPIKGYISGPTGSGRLTYLIKLISELYKPTQNVKSQLQNLFNDYPQIIWFSGSKILTEQSKNRITTNAPELLNYSHFQVYNFAEFKAVINNYKNLMIIIDESCIMPSAAPGLIAKRSIELQSVCKLAQQANISLIIEGSHLPMGVKYSAQIGFRWEKGEFILEKNLLPE